MVLLTINVVARLHHLMVEPQNFYLHGQMPGAFTKTYALYAPAFGSAHGEETRKCHIRLKMDPRTGGLSD